MWDSWSDDPWQLDYYCLEAAVCKKTNEPFASKIPSLIAYSEYPNKNGAPHIYKYDWCRIDFAYLQHLTNRTLRNTGQCRTYL